MPNITRYGIITQDILDRIWENKIEETPDGCQIWKAATNSSGYPHLKINKRMALIHVVFFEMEFGLTDQDIGHTHCYNRQCVNPFHKTIQDRSENILDRDVLTTGSESTYVCGHPRTPENSYLNGYQVSSGTRQYRCKICDKIRKGRK